MRDNLTGYAFNRSLVHVEANFTLSNVKTEAGDYKTVILAKHGASSSASDAIITNRFTY